MGACTVCRWLAMAAVCWVGVPAALGQATDAFLFNHTETHRIRIHNSAGGVIEVSPDGGQSWQAVGTVVRPASASTPGFAASRWAADASVCAMAVHGLRIRIGPAADGERGNLISLVPREFASPPEDFGGHKPAQSGIYTDIPAGTSIFRNLAPFLGNKVLLQAGDGPRPLPPTYRPSVGDSLIIQVAKPRRFPRWITLENRPGGDVIAVFGADEAYLFARVRTPVRGVGRFDATGYTGVGCVNTNHSGVVTISTAADFDGKPLFDDPFGETRGGFMIQPAGHARTEAAAGGPVAQVMVVDSLAGRGARGLEGTPPLFAGFLGLPFQSRDPSRSFVCEMQVDGGDWEPLVPYVGISAGLFSSPTSLERALEKTGRGRFVETGVTAFRILFPEE